MKSKDYFKVMYEIKKEDFTQNIIQELLNNILKDQRKQKLIKLNEKAR